MIHEYEVRKHKLSGKLIVHFRCGKCGAALEAPLQDASKPDQCPDCQTRFITPGTPELQAEIERLKAERDAVEAKRAADLDRSARVIAAADQADRIARAQADAKRRKASKTREVLLLGFILAPAGLVIMLLGMNMGTTVQSESGVVHNLGLMNDKLATVIAGSDTFVAGIVSVGIARLGQEVCRWGDLIAVRLESLKTDDR